MEELKMKKALMRYLGLDPEALGSLKKEITRLKRDIIDLTMTVNHLTDEATKAYKKSEEAIILYKDIDIDKNDKRWFCKDSDHDNIEKLIAEDKIKKRGMKEYVKKHPSLRERFIFHGCCLGCQTPIEKGCGVCLGCQCSDFGSDLPDLSSY